MLEAHSDHDANTIFDRDRLDWHAERQALADLMRQDVSFPPTSVNLRGGNRFHVADGHHRAWASKLCGFTHIPVVVISA